MTRECIFALLSLFVLMVSSAVGQSYRFDFGPGKVAPGYKQVVSETTYSKDRGFGLTGHAPRPPTTEGIIINQTAALTR